MPDDSPDAATLEQELRRLLAPPDKPASRSTAACPTLNLRVCDAISVAPGAGGSAAAFRLIEMAVGDAESSADHRENPLLAARYLLALGDLPTAVTDQVYDAKENRHATVEELISRLGAARVTHLDFVSIKTQRVALATSTSARLSARTNWGPHERGTANASAALLSRIDELLADPAIVDELRQTELRSRAHAELAEVVDEQPATPAVAAVALPQPHHPPAAAPRPIRRRLITIGAAGVVLAAVATVVGLTVFGEADPATASTPVRITTLNYTGLAPVVRSDAVREGQQAINVDGCSDVSEFPKSWDALGTDQEVMLNAKPRRDDVVLVGFSVTSVRHFDRGERVGLIGMCGGNGATSGFTVTDDAERPTIKAFGPGTQPDGKMRLRLDPEALKLDGNASYKLAVHFVGKRDRITVWEGDFIFRYGEDGGRTFRHHVGPARTIGDVPGLTYLQNDDGLWTQARDPGL